MITTDKQFNDLGNNQNKETRIFGMEGLWSERAGKYRVVDVAESSIELVVKQSLSWWDQIKNFLGFSDWVGFYSDLGVVFIDASQLSDNLKKVLVKAAPFFCSPDELAEVLVLNTKVLLSSGF